MAGNRLARVTLTMALATALAAEAACTRGGASAPRPRVARTVLVVDNRSFVDMRIYVSNDGERMRIGYAPGLHVTTLTIPPTIITGARMLTFLADPMGGNATARSEQMYVNHGDTIQLMVPPS